jgi:hypothetical protein
MRLTYLPHPSPEVERFGFGLTSEYVERCHLPVLGPSATALLRLAPLLWAEVGEPAVVPTDELARLIGTSGDGHHAPVVRTMRRLVRLGLGEWIGSGELGIYGTVAPLSDTQLDRVPDRVRAAHHRLLEVHVAALAGAR